MICAVNAPEKGDVPRKRTSGESGKSRNSRDEGKESNDLHIVSL